MAEVPATIVSLAITVPGGDSTRIDLGNSACFAAVRAQS